MYLCLNIMKRNGNVTFVWLRIVLGHAEPQICMAMVNVTTKLYIRVGKIRNKDILTNQNVNFNHSQM